MMPVSIEIYPGDETNNGYCTQGCHDCPAAKKRPGELKYSEKSLDALTLISEKDIYVDSFSIVGLDQNNLTLPKSLDADCIDLSIGKLKGIKDLEDLSKKVIEKVNIVLSKLSRAQLKKQRLKFDIVPDVNEDGIITNIAEIKEFGSHLYKAVNGKEVRGERPLFFYFSMSQNVTNAIGRTKRSEEEIMSHGIEETLNVASDIISSPLKESQFRAKHDDNHNEVKTHWIIAKDYISSGTVGNLVWRFSTNTYKDSDCRVVVASRFSTSNHQNQKYQPLMSGGKMLFSLFPNYVWIDHTTRFASDNTVKIGYPEFMKLLNEHMEEDDLRNAIKAHNEAPRSKLRGICGYSVAVYKSFNCSL